MHLPQSEQASGAVTFLFTDIEGSTALLQLLGDAGYATVLAQHHRLLRGAFEARGGRELTSQGDGFLVAFAHVRHAIGAAVDAQRALLAAPWPAGTAVRVRMGLQTGVPVRTPEGYVGLDVHRAARICQAGWGGQILISQSTGPPLDDDLPEGASLRDLGEHRLKSLERSERIYQLLHPDLPDAFPPLRSLSGMPNNLPQQLTSFVGRDLELTEVKSLFDQHRLVTLTGAGGCGKTRLALHVAGDLAQRYRDGVWLVELAGLSDPAQVPQTVASTLGLRQEPGRYIVEAGVGLAPVAALVDYLKPRQLLLLLDNCEHLVLSCAHLAETLLRACPGVRVLATSREPLGVLGEVPWYVPPLDVPAEYHAGHITGYAAVRLFVERAATACPDFTLTAENRGAVVHVCQRLDGIPLAIELAAARLHVLPVEQIATRLNDRFRLLTTGSRTALPRHRTLKAAMDWSYDLLSEPERMILRRLGVFVGGFTLEAAEGVCAGDEIEATMVLDLLSSLVVKSLVTAEPAGVAQRYKLLETIRQYAVERLIEAREFEALRSRHRDWYAALAERAEPELRGRRQRIWLEHLEVEHDNLRAALAWSAEREQWDAGRRIAGALWWFWYVRGYFAEGRQWLQRTHTGSAAASGAPSARTLYGAALLAWAEGEYTDATALCEQSLAVCRATGDRLGEAYTHTILGAVAYRQGQYERAEALYELGLNLSREAGDSWSIALVVLFLASVALRRRDYARAAVLHKEGVALYRALGDKHGLAYYLYQSGYAALQQQDRDRAAEALEESLTLFTELGFKGAMSSSLHLLGRLAYAQGDLTRALERFTESLTLARQMGYKSGAAYSLYYAGRAALGLGDYDRALAELRASLRLRVESRDQRGQRDSLAALAHIEWTLGARARAARLLGLTHQLSDAGASRPDSGPAQDDGAAAAFQTTVSVAEPQAWREGLTMEVERGLADAMGGDTEQIT